MQNIIDKLNDLQKIGPSQVLESDHLSCLPHDTSTFCEIVSELAETALSILQNRKPCEDIIATDDQCFDSSIKMGGCLAEIHPNDNHFPMLLREAIVFFNTNLFKAITESGFSEIDFACLQLFFSQLCLKVEHGFVEKSHSMLVARKHFCCVSAFPSQMTDSYVCSIIQKLGHIPMAEINFSGNLLHANSNMQSLFKSQSVKAIDLIPECLFEESSILKLAAKTSPEPFFRDICLNHRIFQQLILVLPQNRVFITFVIETPDYCNSVGPSITDACMMQQDPQNEQLNRIKESFLANMSHELRTPLHEIIGFADLLFEQFDGDLNETQLEYVQMIQKGGERLLELINYLLRIGNQSSKKFAKNVPIQKLVSEVMLSLNKDISSKKIDCTVELESEGISFRGDKDRLVIVISEVLSYILKHMRNEGKMSIVFSCQKKWNEIRITVAEAAVVDFSEEMLLSHAIFFLDLMQGHLISEIANEGDKIFKIRLPL